jgi:GT2 family glycosyltransferase
MTSINTPKKALVDIIILTYNNVLYTQRCIENLYQFTSDFNLFIFDNGSTDETVTYLTQLSKDKDNISLFLSDKNVGIISGRCLAYDVLKKSSIGSPYICFLDNDQLVQHGWLETYLELLSQYDVVGTEAWKMRDDFYPYRKIIDKNDFFNYVGAGGLVIKKEVVDTIGLFDTVFEMAYYEDPDFVFRAYKKGFKIGWNYKKKIFHNHKGPLLKPENRIYFMNNWKKFQKKWVGFKLPVFKME